MIRSDFDVDYVDDVRIAQAAWVSTGQDTDGKSEDAIRGLLKFLMTKRHGTPFECGALTIRVNIPIFLWHRHRIGWSYNEESGRYKKLDPVFYVPGESRQLNCLKPPEFKSSKPGFHGMLPLQHSQTELIASYDAAYTLYESRLEAGLDNGLARVCLPVGIYSACYCTCNPRSLMHFLALRVDSENSTYRSHPQWEMHVVSQQLESLFAKLWPITHSLWQSNGRVAP